MDESSKNIDDFEALLKKQTLKRSCRLYTYSNSGNSLPEHVQTSYSAKDILANVSKQIKAIQNADTASYKRVPNKLEKHKKSEFLTVDMMSVDREVHQEKASKFETQCVSDTQLINIIENAEIIDGHRGVTQEFDTTFCQKTDNLDSCDEKESTKKKTDDDDGNVHVAVEATPVVTDLKDKICNIKELTSEMDTLTCQSDIIADGEEDIDNKNKQVDENVPSQNDECLTQCITMESKTPDLSEDRSTSPVLNAGRNIDTPPLVFSLYAFEKFENLVHPIIEEHTDLQSVKNLINSQIIGKELFIPNQCYQDNDKQSPILNNNEHISVDGINMIINEVAEQTIKEDIPKSPEMFDSFEYDDQESKEPNTVAKYELDDEIVFSSDEGDEYVDRDWQDLPLTCALETSFYDESDVLDKTMYVGFQTASNKSIQISKDSFSIAKSILSDIDSNAASLKDLVEVFDSCVDKSRNLDRDNLSGDKKEFTVIENEDMNKVDHNCDKVEHLPEASIRHEEDISDTFKNVSLTALEANSVTNDDIAMSQVIQFKSITSLRPREINTSSSGVLQTDNIGNSKRKLEGFKTASNKRIKLSDKALAECKKIFQDIQLENISGDIDYESHFNKEEGGAKIESETLHMDTGPAINKDDKKCKIEDTEISPINDQEILQEFEDFESFQENNSKDAINNKDHTIADDSASTNLNTLQDQVKYVENDIKSQSNSHISHDQNDLLKKTEIVLETTSNKQIKVSDEALIKTKNAFHDADLGVPQNAEHFDFKLPSTSKFVGFKTAANKDIKISKETLEKMKNFYKDVDIPFDTDESEEKQEYDVKLDNIDDSEVLFAEELALNEDVFNENITDCRKLEVPLFEGFRTASHKAITISKEALAKSKKLFEDISDNYKPSTECENDSFKNKRKHDKDDVVLATVKNMSENNPLKEDFLTIATNSTSVINCKSDTASEEMNINTEFNKPDDIRKVTPEFKGFQTASNKQVKISDKALAKCKKLFEDLDLSQLNEDQSKRNNNAVGHKGDDNFVGFQTASFKPINISNEALAKSKKILNDFELDVSNKEDSEHRVSLDPEPLKSKFLGFTTASNKEVKISADALAKSKKLLSDFDSRDDHNKVRDRNENVSCDKFVGFHTASNKEIEISAEALTKAKNQFKENTNYEGENKKIMELEEKHSPIFKGFQTASNKKVEISAKALLKSRKLFEDLEMSQSKVLDENQLLNDLGLNSVSTKDDLENKTSFDKPSASKVVGFTTASNKEVKISADALSKSKQILKDFELKDICNKVDSNDEHVNKALVKSKKMLNDLELNASNKTTDTFVGFTTASNKEVKISADALAKSKQILSDLDPRDEYNKERDKNEYGSCDKFVGFHTASNKEITISNEALTRSKKIFDEVSNGDKENDVTEAVTKLKAKTNSVFLGFQTASNKQVQISEDALAKSKKLFENIDMCASNTAAEDKEINANFQGFQTASNKKVIISETALAKSKKLFEDLGMSQFNIANETKELVAAESNITDKLDISEQGIERKTSTHTETLEKSTFKGFKTAGDKKVIVSEEALAKSKAICNNIIDTIEIIDIKDNAKAPIIKSSSSNLTTNLNVVINSDSNITNVVSNMIDTQVLNDFEESVNTEDFCKSTPKSKRSGSPILSCPRAKKRKFETPYTNKVKKIEEVNSFQPPKLAKTYKFQDDYKKNKKYTLKDLKMSEKDSESSIDPYVTKFNFDQLLKFEFFDSRNDYNEAKIDIEQLKKLFLDSVNKKIVPDGWLDNHIKLIIWKLISYEVKFPKTMKNTCTVKNVMEQLKYRYDRELYNVQRPILRKILEKDDVASKTMVLCVAAIYVDDVSVASVPATSQNIELLLTDGWYTIKAFIDRMLTKLVCDGRIVVGCKIATSGAELLNCEQGIAPWEDTSSVRLKLTGNSTRRARWHSRLGPRTAIIRSPLGSIDAAGGRTSVTVLVTRVYPALYVERMGDGSTVTLSERLEHIRQMKYESERQILMEKLYEELEKELIDQESQDSEGCQTNCLDSGSQISKQMKKSRDPDEYRSHLTKSQHILLEEHTSRKREKQIEALRVKFQDKLDSNGLNTERNVVPLMKVRVAGFRQNRGSCEVCKGFLSIWKPSAAVVEIITEGAWIDILNVIPTGNRNSEIQLSAGRQTIFNPYRHKNDKYKLYTDTFKRKCYEIKELSQNPNMVSDYNEIDTVGLIFHIEPTTKEFDHKKQNFQNVYLADAEKNMICVNFWGGLKKFGFENILDTGQIVTCVNLQKRAGNTRKSIPHYRVTEFSYFTKTPKDNKAAGLTDELSNKLSKIKEKFCEDCVVLKENFSLFKARNIENVSPYRFGTDNRLETPKRCDANLNLTGLDFESTFRTESQLSPVALLRKKKVNEKIEKLHFLYGEPPPLSSIRIINQSKNASANYKSPLIPKSNVASGETTPNVTSVEKELDLQNVASPLNRTFVKQINPVKLNFSNTEDENLNETVDHFAEEFDASPPLSLDSDIAS